MKKILLILGGVAGLLMVSALLLPVLFKDKIAARAQEEINRSIRARASFTDAGLSVLRNFPNLTFCLENFCITGIEHFEGDTLVYLRSLQVQLNLFDVIGGSQIGIQSIVLDEPFIHIIVLRDGRANYDIMKSDTAETAASKPAAFKASIQSYSAHQARIVYDDLSLGFKMKLEGLNHKGKGDFSQDVFLLSTTTEIEEAHVWYGAVKYLSKVQAELLADLEIDNRNSKYTFKDNKLTLNELPLHADGWLSMPAEDIDMDLTWSIAKSDFKSLVSLIPGMYTESFRELKSSGTFTAGGFVRGTYSDQKLPAFEANLKVENGMFQYPSLPSSVGDVVIDLKVSNPDGIDDHTILDLKKFHASLGGQPVDARLFVSTPVSDANIDGQLKGTIDLALVKNYLPLEKETNLSGILRADLSMKGRYSSIEKKQYDQFQAGGIMEVRGLKYASKDYPPLTIRQLLLSFSPAVVRLAPSTAQLGKSDLSLRGQIDNLIGYYLKNELLKGSFVLKSTLLDLNELMTGPVASSRVPDTSALTVLEVPSNVDLVVDATAAKILYDNLIIENLKGSLEVAEQTVSLRNLLFTLLGGSVVMNGRYATVNPARPEFDFRLAMKQFDIGRSAAAFPALKKMAPVAERCSGTCSTDMTIGGSLSQNMQPLLNTLSGSGRLTTSQVTLSNFEPVNKMAEALKMDQFKKLLVKDLDLYYEFSDGRMRMKPLTTDVNGIRTTVSGSNGFDQTIDYDLHLRIPKSKIPPSATTALSGIVAQANKALSSNFSLPDTVQVRVALGGTVTKPEVRTDWKQQAQSVAENLREELEEKAEEQIEQAKAQARAEADQILAEAEKQAQAIRDAAKVSADKLKKEGYAAADKLVAEASNPIARLAAEKSAQEAKKQVDKQAQQVIDEGNKQAQKVLDEAKKKADELLR